MKNSLIFLDTETTGKGPDDRLIQICLLGQGWHEPLTLYYKAPVKISFEAMATHHITQEFIDNMPEMAEDEKKRIQIMLEGKILVAHNAPFDIAMLAKEGIKVDRYIDTLKVAQYLFDEPSYKLQYLRYRFGLKIEARAHDAEGDVLVLKSVFNYLAQIYKQANRLDTEDSFDKCVEWMEEISKKPALLRHISFGKHNGKTFDDLVKNERDYLVWLSKQNDLDENLKFTLDYYLNKNAAADVQERLF